MKSVVQTFEFPKNKSLVDQIVIPDHIQAYLTRYESELFQII
jgi:hypothetical protein